MFRTAIGYRKAKHRVRVGIKAGKVGQGRLIWRGGEKLARRSGLEAKPGSFLMS